MAKRNRKSRGRDLKHTETQAAIDISRRVTNERGRTDGLEKIGAVSAVSPGLRRRKPRTKVATHLTQADINRLPAGAKIVQTQGRGIPVMAIYNVADLDN